MDIRKIAGNSARGQALTSRAARAPGSRRARADAAGWPFAEWGQVQKEQMEAYCNKWCGTVVGTVLCGNSGNKCHVIV